MKTNALEKKIRPNANIWSIDERTNLFVELEQKVSRNQSHFLFDLTEVNATFKETKPKLAISVAKHYSYLKHEEIESIVESIKNINKVSNEDFIIKTSESHVLSIGTISGKNRYQGKKISFDVIWLADVSSEDYILHEMKNQFFQKLGPNNFYAVEGNSGSKLEKDLSNLGWVSLDNKRIQQEELSHNFKEFEELLFDEDEKGGSVKIFYGTNRIKEHNKKFGNELGPDLNYGLCEVSIPRGHIQGNLERPLNLWLYEFKERENKHIILKGVEEMQREDFTSQLTEWIKLSNEKAALIFIHGFNTSFEEAARRTGQLAWDIPFEGPTGFFSWPSSGSLLSYSADEEKSESSAPDFSKFLMEIINNTGVERIHIIAHSMGSRVLSFSLNQLAKDADFQKKSHVIQQLVLGAPDIDQEKFKKIILPNIISIGAARTLYSSDKDKAMIASHTLRGGRPRLGEAGDSIFVENGIDTIEVSNMPLNGLKHNYIFEAKELLIDLYYLLSKGMNPSERRLKAVPKGKFKYWLFVK